jgi:hypothetical protein
MAERPNIANGLVKIAKSAKDDKELMKTLVPFYLFLAAQGPFKSNPESTNFKNFLANVGNPILRGSWIDILEDVPHHDGQMAKSDLERISVWFMFKGVG